MISTHSSRTLAQADDIVGEVVSFVRSLRAAGADVSTDRVATALRALDVVGFERREDVYWALRATLISCPHELSAFDHALAAGAHRDEPDEDVVARAFDTAAGEAPEAAAARQTVGYSPRERLRTTDFAALSPEEREDALALVAGIAVARPRRRTRRLQRNNGHGGTLDARMLMRASLATGGEPIRRTYRPRAIEPRRLVLLLDISGSMETHARALLVFAHAASHSGRGVEVFAFGTRLTRLTTELTDRAPSAAVAAAAAQVADWSGGTRIGASLKAYNDLWGRRGLTRGAVVVIVSDGWERQDEGLVASEMARLARQAYAVVWANPLKGRPQYLPLAHGMRAALPYVDHFVSGHDVASLERLAALLTRIGRRRRRLPDPESSAMRRRSVEPRRAH